MDYTKLSEIPPLKSVKELIDFLLDSDSHGLINDLTPAPNVEYDLSDLLVVGERFLHVA